MNDESAGLPSNRLVMLSWLVLFCGITMVIFFIENVSRLKMEKNNTLETNQSSIGTKGPANSASSLWTFDVAYPGGMNARPTEGEEGIAPNYNRGSFSKRQWVTNIVPCPLTSSKMKRTISFNKNNCKNVIEIRYWIQKVICYKLVD